MRRVNGYNNIKIYRFFLFLALSMAIAMLFFIFYIGYWNKIPSKLSIKAGVDQTLDLKVPVSGKIYPAKAYKEEAIAAEECLSINLTGKVIMKANEVQDYKAKLRLFGVIPYKDVDIQVIKDIRLTPAGIPVGIYVKTKGALVVGVGNFQTDLGRIAEPAKYKLRDGDYILEVNGIPVSGKKQLTELIEKSDGKEMTLKVLREGGVIEVLVTPQINKNGEYRLGIWIRDNAQGIGTLTYVDDSGRFGALGHGINDIDTSILMNLSAGAMYQTNIIGITKGKQGLPGELTGYIAYDENHKLGDIIENTGAGIFGVCGEETEESFISEQIPIALKQDIQVGDAQIISSVTGEPAYYSVEITEVRMDSDNVNRGIVLKVTDKKLLEMTGGIVQGMSGSPIIQNGKLIGAITHVFVNDPERGYGIFIENMLGTNMEFEQNMGSVSNMK